MPTEVMLAAPIGIEGMTCIYILAVAFKIALSLQAFLSNPKERGIAGHISKPLAGHHRTFCPAAVGLNKGLDQGYIVLTADDEGGALMEF